MSEGEELMSMQRKASFTLRRLKLKKMLFHPSRVAMVGFLMLILCGAYLLTLPCMSTGDPLAFSDALFTATSAVCVTGLTVVNPGPDLTFWGQLTLISLIQVGGLGVMTFGTVLLVLLRRRITLSERVILSDSLNAEGLQGMVRLTLRIVGLALSVEGTGAVLLMTRMIPLHGVKGVWYAIFHSISAFCNAGFDLAGGFEYYQNDFVVLMVISALITIGGIGFSVIFDLQSQKGRWQRLSVHTRLVLVMSAILTFGGALLYCIFEWNNPNTLDNGVMHTLMKPVNALFQSVTVRTAGFQTFAQGGLTAPAMVLTLLLMLIGASPASTGGGIKTTTFAVFCLLVYNVLRGRDRIVVYRKTINQSTVNRAVVLTTLALLLIVLAHIVLSVILTPSDAVNSGNILYEVISALATVGLTIGVTGELTLSGKLVMCAVMFTGRVGLMTIAFGLTRRHPQGKNNLTYPEGRVMIG